MKQRRKRAISFTFFCNIKLKAKVTKECVPNQGHMAFSKIAQTLSFTLAHSLAMRTNAHVLYIVKSVKNLKFRKNSSADGKKIYSVCIKDIQKSLCQNLGIYI